MDQFVHLRLGGGDDLGIDVSGVDHRNAGEAVEIFAAVNVGDGDSARLVDHDRHDRLHEAGHYVIFIFLDRIGHSASILGQFLPSFLENHSEFSRMFFRPALDNNFLFGVELDAITALGVRSPKKLSFHPLNGKYAMGAATPILMPILPAGAS